MFYITIADADIESLKSPDTFLILISICSTCMLVKFEQNHMVRTTQNVELLTKMVNHFWQSVDVILKDVSVAEAIVWCQTINLKTTIFQYYKKIR